MGPEREDASRLTGGILLLVIQRERADTQHSECPFLGLMILDVAPQGDKEVHRFRRRAFMPPQWEQMVCGAVRCNLMGEQRQLPNANKGTPQLLPSL